MANAGEILDALAERIDNGTYSKDMDEAAKLATKDMWFAPNPGPQTDAYFCEADELFYGGKAGGGKSALICGLTQEHERTLILRRIRADAGEMAEDEFVGGILKGDRSKWNGTDLRYRDGKRVVKFAGCERLADRERHKGRPYDLMAFDEIPDFLFAQYIFITIWNRSATNGQRSRIVVSGNPPTTPEGLWVIKHWAAWLDSNHPNPAKEGELRWYVRDAKGDEQEVDGIGPHEIDGELMEARSRTFISADLADNPDLNDDGQYKRSLNMLPLELRDAYRDGNFSMDMEDKPFQVLPTAWVQLAMARWKANPTPPEGVPMSAMGVDPAGGGPDRNAFAMRYGHWLDEVKTVPGSEIPLGENQTPYVQKWRRDRAFIHIDCGGGYGNSTYGDLRNNETPQGESRVIAYRGSTTPQRKRTKDGLLQLLNRRAEVYWNLRELLDPTQRGGSHICLPDDPELLAELTALQYTVKTNTIRVTEKAKLVADLGVSPDKADAVTLAFSAGYTIANYREGDDWGQGEEYYDPRRSHRPKANMTAPSSVRRNQRRRR